MQSIEKQYCKKIALIVFQCSILPLIDGFQASLMPSRALFWLTNDLNFAYCCVSSRKIMYFCSGFVIDINTPIN